MSKNNGTLPEDPTTDLLVELNHEVLDALKGLNRAIKRLQEALSKHKALIKKEDQSA